MGPSVGSQQELSTPSLPTITPQTSEGMGEKPRQAPAAVPPEANAVTVALVPPAISQSAAPPAPLAAQPGTDSMFSVAGNDAR